MALRRTHAATLEELEANKAELIALVVDYATLQLERDEERVALGVPSPGDAAYWTPAMRTAVAARFPGTSGWWREGS